MIAPVVSIVGTSGSGKTTLLEKVVGELVGKGYSVGTIKHDAHGFELDREGKDSWRHKKAGAKTVVLSSPGKLAVIKDIRGEWPPERIASSFFPDADIVITEGYKKGPFPKIEVIRKANKKKPVCLKDKGLIAIATDTGIKAVNVPVYPLGGHKPIARLIEKIFLRRKSGAGLCLMADGKVVALKPFIDAMLKEAVIGMVKSLKHCSKAREIEIRVKR